MARAPTSGQKGQSPDVIIFSIKFTKQTRRLFRGIWIKVSTNTHATIPGADNLTTNPHYQYLIQWDPIQSLRTECKFIKFNTEKLQVEKITISLAENSRTRNLTQKFGSSSFWDDPSDPPADDLRTKLVHKSPNNSHIRFTLYLA